MYGVYVHEATLWLIHSSVVLSGNSSAHNHFVILLCPVLGMLNVWFDLFLTKSFYF